MFNIIDSKEQNLNLTARVSILRGKYNIYLPEIFVGKRFDYTCKKDRIEIKLNPDGERIFSVNKSDTHPSGCPGLVSEHVAFQNAYTDEFELKLVDGIYVIELGEFREKYPVKKTDVSFDFQGFYRSIDEAGLEPFIYNGEIAFRRK